MTTAPISHRRAPEHPWLSALGFTVPVTGLILGLMVKWFALSNRYVTFLYHHDMGQRVPDTRPFSMVTRSRYWMTGLVAAGAIMILVAGANLVLGRLSRRYHPPKWWRIWVLCAGPLLIGIPVITMTYNSPTLPFWLAALTTATTLVGLALALTPGRITAEQPLKAGLLGLDGLCLALWLLILPGLEYASMWISNGNRVWLLMLGLLPLAGLVGLAAITLLQALFHLPLPTYRELSMAALVISYLFFPIAHHVGFTDGLYYISNMENFFTRNLVIQVLTFAVTAAIIWLTTRTRRTLLLRK